MRRTGNLLYLLAGPVVDRFIIPAVFDPSYSPLGRLLRARSDRLRAEAQYYLYATTEFFLLTFAAFVAWAVLRDQVVEDPAGSVAVAFFVTQAVVFLGFGALCVLGFRPAAVITMSAETLDLRQGRRAVRIRLTEIADMRAVPDLAVHRHYRRYRRFLEFSGRRVESYLLLRTSKDDVIGLGLPDGQLQDFVDALQRRLVDSEPEFARVAP